MKRRTVIVLAIAAVALLVAAPAAMAAGGGGTSGFGGGGGEGGGGGGRYFLLFQILIRVALLGHGLGAIVLIALAVVWAIFSRVAPAASARWSERPGRAHRRRASRRERQVQLAAAEAAEDDPAFAPEKVKPAAADLFARVQRAWDSVDRAALRRAVTPDLLVEWERRLDDFEMRGWRNRVTPVGRPKIEYVGLTRRGNALDRAVVRIEAKLQDYVVDLEGNRIKRRGHLGETRTIREYWTLTRHGDGWVLASVEHGAEGAHALEDQIVTTPWADDQALRDEALVEQAAADAPEATAAELTSVDFDGDAHAQALDLSLADGRFAPDVLEVAARRAADAWAHAVDGDDTALGEIAEPLAARELLHPGDPIGRTRLVVRGPRVTRIRIAHLDARGSPPTMTVEVDLIGRRYIEDRDTTAVLAGSRRRATSFTERWTFALAGDATQPWRIVAVDAPVGLA